MKYVSTRGRAAPVDFRAACLAGLAPDGGLYVPQVWPQIAPAALGEAYATVAARVLSAFAGDTVSAADLSAMCVRAYGHFAHPDVAPLTPADGDIWQLELHHGPTLAFKDIAMQIIAELYAHFLSRAGARMMIVCATSGDTGGAAAAAFAGSAHVDLAILHPHNRIAPVQRLFMTTTGAANISNLAVHGDFDDCQSLVKALFADTDFAARVNLSGVNSINWARIAAQVVYYATAATALGRPARFVVPSGNMGDALAGYVAGRCGLLPDGFSVVCAVNENDALARIFASGQMQRAPAVATPSPAMDISVPSNFERLLFELCGRDGAAVAGAYARYARTGAADVPGWHAGVFAAAGFSAARVSNAETLAEMQRFYQSTGSLICPHTAVGMAAARRALPDDRTPIVLATAAAAKFPETVRGATGALAALPDRCAALQDQPETFTQITAELDAVRQFISAKAQTRS
jgi:threonine synthase